jgi:hypothetical protein
MAGMLHPGQQVRVNLAAMQVGSVVFHAAVTTGDLSNRTARAITQLCEAFAHGGPGRGRTDGSFNTSSSVSSIDRDEPASIPKAVEAAEG